MTASRTRAARVTRLIPLACFGLLAVAACGGGDEGSGAEETDTLSISATGVDSLPFMAMLQAGVDKGWFEEAGLEVEMYSGGGGGNTLRVVTSGDADMAIAGNSSVLLAAQKPEGNLTVVAPWFQVNDFHWIAPEGRSIEGATLGFSSAGSSTELIIKGMEKEIDISSQAVGGMGDNWTAAKADQITAGWAMQPFVTQKQVEEDAEVLVSARDVIGDLPADLVAVNTDYLESNPENVTTFFEVSDRIMTWVVEEPEEAAEAIGPLIDVDVEIVAEAIQNTPEFEQAYSLQVDPDALENLSELMIEAGQITEPVDWSSMLDQQYLPESDRADF